MVRIKRDLYLPISPEDILTQGNSTKDELAKALYFFIYLTGARIGEAVRFKLHDLERFENYYKIRLPVEKKRDKTKYHTRSVIIPCGAKAKCLENEMLKVVLEFLKNNTSEYPFWVWGKGNQLKNIPPRPSYMSQYLRRNCYIEAYAQTKTTTGWMEIKKQKLLNPHYLRHCRASHLATKQYYDLNDAQLKLFFEWSPTSDMPGRYTHLRDKEKLFGL